MGVAENKQLVRRFYEEVWDRGNVEFAHEVFADDYVRHDLRPTQALPGAAGMARIASSYQSSSMKFRGQGKRLLFDPDDRPLDPLLGEPAANFDDELSNVSWRRRPLVVDIPGAVAPFVDSATLAP